MAEGKNEKLLKEIRDTFTYYQESWRSIREEARKDMQYVSGNPWDPKEKRAREDAGRPCLALDELNQYINQLINDVRQNKRSIRVVPVGAGANDKTAELRGNLIRQIEYKSNAQSAYATAFEDAAQRSYGYFRINTQYCDDEGFDQELVIKRIPNPDTVLIDPDCKEADCSDMKACFIVDVIPKEKFKRDWPNAEVRDFGPEHLEAAPQWIRENQIQIAEYWKVKTKLRKRVVVEGPEGPTTHFADELPEGFKGKTTKERKVEEKTVCQYITNGIEILEENEWAGEWIPIVPVFGKELYVDDGSGAKRVLMSMIRLARDPYMLYCYYRTCEAELVGMTPKTPYIGYEGQFEGHEEEWQNVNKVPIPYLQVKPVTDAGGQNVLPLPQRQPYEPALQALELGAEAAKRAIQSALGRYNTSVGRADTKATSGVAIKALDLQSDQGSFHFIDNFERALEHAGRILNDLIPKIYDTSRDIGIRSADETHQTIRINEPEYVDPETNQPVHHDTQTGDHDVTISTGPSFQSQREEASAFADTLANIPQIFPLVADLVVKLKNLGPIGDEIAKRLTPPQFAGQDMQNLPPQVLQAVQQLQQHVQMLNAYAKKLEEEKAAKVVDNEYMLKKAQMDNEVKVAIAEITTKAQSAQFRAELEADIWAKVHQAAHDAAMQALEQAHQKDLAQQSIPANGGAPSPEENQAT